MEFIDFIKIEAWTDEINSISEIDFSSFHSLKHNDLIILLNQMKELSLIEGREYCTVLYYDNHKIVWNNIIFVGDCISSRFKTNPIHYKRILIHTHPNKGSDHKYSNEDIMAINSANIDISIILCANCGHVYSNCLNPYNHTHIQCTPYGSIGFDILILPKIIERLEREI